MTLHLIIVQQSLVKLHHNIFSLFFFNLQSDLMYEKCNNHDNDVDSHIHVFNVRRSP